MKVLFLDQSGQLGGAELSLRDLAAYFKKQCLVCLFEHGPFAEKLSEEGIPCRVIQQKTLRISKDSGFIQGLFSIRKLLPLVIEVIKMARDYQIIYANTQKALVVGAIASVLSRKPLVYHLRDILSAEHFSPINQKVAVTLANTCASLVIANSQATRQAFIDSGGKSQCIKVVYNGFDAKLYQAIPSLRQKLQNEFSIKDGFWIGHFSRFSPWKGQHILIEALRYLDTDVMVLLAGKALFGEDQYVQQLQTQIQKHGLQDRVYFLGFRSDIPALMASCDLVAHTSTAPEPFGRVIVEAMFSGCPVIAANAGGATELIEHGQTGWLCQPNNPQNLAELIASCREQTEQKLHIAMNAKTTAQQKFSLDQTNQAIILLLEGLTMLGGLSKI